MIFENDESEGQLTVKRLIELLQFFPPEAAVFHEGCSQCWQESKFIEYDASDNTIEIKMR